MGASVGQEGQGGPMTRRSVLAVLAGLIAVLAIGALNYPLYEHVRDQRVLEQTGVVASAPVVATEQQGSGEDATYTVTWQVPGPDGAPTSQERTSEIDAAAFRAADDQRTIDVRYPADRPQLAYAEARTGSAPGLPTWVLWADAGLLALLVLIGATVGRSRVRSAADRFLSPGDEERSTAEPSAGESHVTR